jgi:hypothetical protein
LHMKLRRECTYKRHPACENVHEVASLGLAGGRFVAGGHWTYEPSHPAELCTAAAGYGCSRAQECGVFGLRSGSEPPVTKQPRSVHLRGPTLQTHIRSKALSQPCKKEDCRNTPATNMLSFDFTGVTIVVPTDIALGDIGAVVSSDIIGRRSFKDCTSSLSDLDSTSTLPLKGGCCQGWLALGPGAVPWKVPGCLLALFLHHRFSTSPFSNHWVGKGGFEKNSGTEKRTGGYPAHLSQAPQTQTNPGENHS